MCSDFSKLDGPQQGLTALFRIKETTSSRNKRRLWEMRWTDERGESGRARPDYKDRFETLSPGDEISVFRDPGSDRVFWERDLQA